MRSPLDHPKGYRFVRDQEAFGRIKKFLRDNDIPLSDTPLDTVMEFGEDTITLDQFVRVDGERVLQGESFARQRVSFPLTATLSDIPLCGVWE